MIAVIGDIHGCYKTLLALYNKLKKHTDEVYSVGDLIDRGPSSKDVVQFCIDNNIKTIVGNHEEMLVDLFKNDLKYDIDDVTHHFHNGGRKTMASYTGSQKSSIEDYYLALQKTGHLEFFRSLPYKMEFEKVIITHAGISSSTEDTVWHRNTLKQLDKLQIIGHTPVHNMIYEKDWFVNIDTGAVYKDRGYGLLTGVIIDEHKGEVVKAYSVTTIDEIKT